MRQLTILFFFIYSVLAYCQNFNFAIIADAHLDYNTDTISLRNIFNKISDGKPSFIVDLGDTFMTEKYGKEYKDSEWQYKKIKELYDLINAPVYFVIGNHDGAYANKNPDINKWAMSKREEYFPGSSNTFYSFRQADVEIFVLDPYKYSPRSASRMPENRTLGTKQLKWLKQALSKSTAKYKLIFTHSLVGGADLKGRDRGGAEVANMYEWGDTIHPLLKKHDVKAVFHGHDHIYVKQELDGIIYQCVPQPAAVSKGRKENRNEKAISIAHEYGYLSGDILGGSGYLNCSVSDNEITVSFISQNGQIDKYIIK